MPLCPGGVFRCRQTLAFSCSNYQKPILAEIKLCQGVTSQQHLFWAYVLHLFVVPSRVTTRFPTKHQKTPCSNDNRLMDRFDAGYFEDSKFPTNKIEPLHDLQACATCWRVLCYPRGLMVACWVLEDSRWLFGHTDSSQSEHTLVFGDFRTIGQSEHKWPILFGHSGHFLGFWGCEGSSWVRQKSDCAMVI